MITTTLREISFTSYPEIGVDYDAIVKGLPIDTAGPILLDLLEIIIASGEVVPAVLVNGHKRLAAIGRKFGADIPVAFTPCDNYNPDYIDGLVVVAQSTGIYDVNDYLAFEPVEVGGSTEVFNTIQFAPLPNLTNFVSPN